AFYYYVCHGPRRWREVASIDAQHQRDLDYERYSEAAHRAMALAWTALRNRRSLPGNRRGKHQTMNRREFLGAAAALAACTLAEQSSAAMMPASDRVNLAIIGPGSRGQQLMRTFLRVPGVRFAALCDIYEPRWEQARKITGENTRAIKDYR